MTVTGGYRRGRSVASALHVHWSVAIFALVNSLERVSSRRLRQRFEMRTHQDHFWSPSYLAASACGPPRSIIRQYVETQRQPA